MLVRNLKDYKWSYETKMITFLDRQTGNFIQIPINKASSVQRACIAFKDRFKIESVEKIRKASSSKIKELREKIRNLRDMKRDEKNNDKTAK